MIEYAYSCRRFTKFEIKPQVQPYPRYQIKDMIFEWEDLYEEITSKTLNYLIASDKQKHQNKFAACLKDIEKCGKTQVRKCNKST